MGTNEKTSAINADYIQHDISLAMDLLIVGITKSGNKNDTEVTIMRATLNLLEFLKRNIGKAANK